METNKNDEQIPVYKTRYTKPLDEPLVMYECIQLLDTLAENGIIHRDPQNRNNILVYIVTPRRGITSNTSEGSVAREKDSINPEGWFSQNLISAAEELLGDIDGQQFLRRELESRNIDMVFDNILKGEDHLKNVTFLECDDYDSRG